MPYRSPTPPDVLHHVSGACIDLREVIALQHTSNGITTGARIYLRGGQVIDVPMANRDYDEMTSAYCAVHQA